MRIRAKCAGAPFRVPARRIAKEGKRERTRTVAHYTGLPEESEWFLPRGRLPKVSTDRLTAHEPLPILHRTQAHSATKVIAQRRRGAEAASSGDFLDRKIGRFEKLACTGDARVDQPIRGCLAGGFLEATNEVARAHRGKRSHRIDRERFVQSLGQVDYQISEAPVPIRQHWTLDELRLTAVSVRRDHQSARDLVRDCGAEIAANEMQAQIQSSGATGGRQNASGVHVQYVRIDVDVRVLR